MLTFLRVKKACITKLNLRLIERLKRYFVLGRLLPFIVIQESYAKRKRNRNKGLGMVEKMKFALRKVFVNGLFMRKASVLKQNKYREK